VNRSQDHPAERAGEPLGPIGISAATRAPGTQVGRARSVEGLCQQGQARDAPRHLRPGTRGPCPRC